MTIRPTYQISWFTDIAAVEITSDEYKHLQEYLIKSHGATHDVSFKVCKSSGWLHDR